MGSRRCIWFFWFIMALVTGAYCALSLLTFSNVYKAYEKSDKSGNKDRPVLAILAASFFGSVMVFMYAFVSFCILLGGFKDEVQTRFENDSENAGISWGKADTSAFQASFWMAYVCTIVYLTFFIILVCDKGAVRKTKHESAKLEESVKE